MSKKILIVDDEHKIRNVIRTYLEKEGFEVLEAVNGEEALYSARKEKPDLIVLDVMMPKMDGYEFMHTFRKEANLPIIMLTAKSEDADEVLGLELGADDYVSKPFEMRTLLARIRAVLRRTSRGPEEKEILKVGPVSVDRSSRKAFLADQPLDLTPTEFDLLSIFLANPGIAFSRLDLLQKIDMLAFEGVERTIDVHIFNLRNKIEKDPKNPVYIETVYGMGYRFMETE